jgi:hypothetical protein
MPVDFARHSGAFLRHFGTPLTLWPGQPGEVDIQAVLYRSARGEIRSPGDAERALVFLTDLPDGLPAANDMAAVGSQRYAIISVTDQGDGSAALLLRKKN